MTTPEEEAKVLVGKFYKITKQEGYYEEFQEAKKCALICVDEKQETIDKMFNGYYTMTEEWQKEYDELEEVKQEIKKIITL